MPGFRILVFFAATLALMSCETVERDETERKVAQVCEAVHKLSPRFLGTPPDELAEALALNNEGVRLEWAGSREEAREHYRAAADLGLSAASYNLATTYWPGYPDAQDPVAAVPIYRRAADAGHPLAMINLGLLLVYNDVTGIRAAAGRAHGRGDRRSADASHIAANSLDREAGSLLRKAADMGFSIAQYELAVLLDQGRLRQVSDDETKIWFQRAAERRHTYAQHSLAEAYAKEGRNDLALQWYAVAAGAGLPQAQFALGVLYRDGSGATRDIDKARYWFRRATEKEPWVYAPDLRPCLLPYEHARAPGATQPPLFDTRERAAAQLSALEAEGAAETD